MSDDITTVPGAERREHPRIIIDSPIELRRQDGATVSGIAEDISTGGVRIRCPTEAMLRAHPAHGSSAELALRIVLSDIYGGEVVQGRAEVVWFRRGEDESSAGLRYTHLDAASVALLAELARAATADAREALEMLTRPSGQT